MSLFTEDITTNVEAQENVRDLIAALRSGAFEQGQSQLLTVIDDPQYAPNGVQDYYCCLGVMCHLYDSTRWRLGELRLKDREDREDAERWIWGEDYTPEFGGLYYLPDEVRVAFCFQTPTGVLDYGETLASMNDNGSSFLTISNVIAERFAAALGFGIRYDEGRAVILEDELER